VAVGATSVAAIASAGSASSIAMLVGIATAQ
jgi:hypothetical protein